MKTKKKNKDKGIIYVATFPNKKRYVGQTLDPLKKRIFKHVNSAHNKKCNEYNTKMGRAIRKYGEDNIKWKVLYSDIDKGKLDQLEVKTIKKYNSKENGYNSTDGGNGCLGYKHTEESKRRMSRMRKKLYKNNPSKIKRGEANGASKLTVKKVNKIRKLYLFTNLSQQKIADKFGVSRRLIGMIVSNYIWHDSEFIPQKINKQKKYTDAFKNEIITRFKTGKYTAMGLGREYKVPFQTICYILKATNDNKIKLILKNNRMHNNEMLKKII